MKPRKLTEKDVEFTVEAQPEDMPIEGNASAWGDEEDKKYADWIRDQLDRGNEWAWCCVRVAARICVTVERKGRVDQCVSLEGVAYLGGCCYKSREDFMGDGGSDYFGDMKAEALDDLQAKVDALASLVAE